MFNAVVNYIDLHHSHRLHKVVEVAHRFPEFNQRIKEKLESEFPGVPLPEEAEGVALFSDVCRHAVCRPGG